MHRYWDRINTTTEATDSDVRARRPRLRPGSGKAESLMNPFSVDGGYVNFMMDDEAADRL